MGRAGLCATGIFRRALTAVMVPAIAVFLSFAYVEPNSLRNLLLLAMQCAAPLLREKARLKPQLASFV